MEKNPSWDQNAVQLNSVPNILFLPLFTLLPQGLSSTEGKGNNVSSFKIAIISQKENHQCLQNFLELLVETNLYLTCPIAGIPKSLPGNNNLQIFTLNKCKALALVQSTIIPTYSNLKRVNQFKPFLFKITSLGCILIVVAKFQPKVNVKVYVINP